MTEVHEANWRVKAQRSETAQIQLELVQAELKTCMILFAGKMFGSNDSWRWLLRTVAAL